MGFIKRNAFHLVLYSFMAGAMVVLITCAGAGIDKPVTIRELKGVIEVGELTPSETKRLEGILNSEVSPCGEAVSLGRAMLEPRVCPLVPMAFEFIVDLVKQDYNAKEISEAYMSRYAALKGLEIPVDGSPRKGAEDPAITIVVFSDFQCPFCTKKSRELDRLVRAYPDKLELVFKNYVLSTHPMSEPAARAAFAAHQQGKFWEMHDALYSTYGTPLDKERIDVIAVGLGLDMDRYEEDYGSPAATSALEADKRLGDELGVKGTPYVFVNGRPLAEGEPVEERLKEEFIRYSILNGDKSNK